MQTIFSIDWDCDSNSKPIEMTDIWFFISLDSVAVDQCFNILTEKENASLVAKNE